MIRAALTAALIAATTLPSHAGTVGVHLVSKHEADTHEVTAPDGSKFREEYNNRNPGLYYIADSGLTVGAYRNSYFHSTVYAGWTWHGPTFGPLQPSVTAVLATGYRRVHGVGLLRPMVLPSLRLEGPAGVALRYHLGPAKGGVFQHLAVERSF
jgi:hypothetical protein